MVWDEGLRNIIISLVILLIMLAVVYKIVPVFQSVAAPCTADIMAMEKLPNGKGIRCPTEALSIRDSPATALAREIGRCAERYGNFQYDLFKSTSINICLICSSGNIAEEVRDIDIALLEEKQREIPIYQILTGKVPTANLRAELRKAEDTFEAGPVAIVWVRSKAETIDGWLADAEIPRAGELWHGNILGLPEMIGIGNGIFRPDHRGLSQGVFLASQDRAEQLNCVSLGKERYLPPG
ncbi:MAG TPA: hypothetical protein VJK52_03310 [Candidatus Nanoarchaeia archaeon]|nr:hypothetical protein [Candidatus Nanoarchaeia archaeon]